MTTEDIYSQAYKKPISCHSIRFNYELPPNQAAFITSMQISHKNIGNFRSQGNKSAEAISKSHMAVSYKLFSKAYLESRFSEEVVENYISKKNNKFLSLTTEELECMEKDAEADIEEVRGLNLEITLNRTANRTLDETTYSGYTSLKRLNEARRR